MSDHSAENDAPITEAACQRLRGYVYQHEGMCWCGFDSEGVNGEGETLDHIVHSLVSDWQGFLATATTPIPPAEGSGYCPDACTWPHDHRFERDGIPWPARTRVTPPADGGTDEHACRCDCAYVGAQMAGTSIRCEQCGGLVDEVAAERMEAVYAESRRRLEQRAATHVIPPGSSESEGDR